MVASVYGWATQDTVADKHVRTSALCEAVLGEIHLWPRVPVIFAGDLNAQADKLPSLRMALAQGVLYDVGALAQVWGGEAAQHTACAHNSVVGSRIDYMCVSSAMMPRVCSFELDGRF
eukprot:13099593-Alexandrium_andersonii.AAC.1